MNILRLPCYSGEIRQVLLEPKRTIHSVSRRALIHKTQRPRTFPELKTLEQIYATI